MRVGRLRGCRPVLRQQCRWAVLWATTSPTGIAARVSWRASSPTLLAQPVMPFIDTTRWAPGPGFGVYPAVTLAVALPQIAAANAMNAVNAAS